MSSGYNASTGEPEKTGMTSEVTISLVVVGLLVIMLLVAIGVVLVYYWNQSRRMTQPKKDSRQPGYRTTINSDKLKKYAAAKVQGVDEMKEPVNWSNRGRTSGRSSTTNRNSNAPTAAMQPQQQLRCRSLSPQIPAIEQLWQRQRQQSVLARI